MVAVYAYDQLDGVSECRVQKSSDCLAQWNSKLFCGKSEERCQGYDGNEVENELKRRRPVGNARDDAHGYKHQEDIDVVGLEDLPSQM